MDAKGDAFVADELEGSDRRAVMIFRLDRTSDDAKPDPLYCGSSLSGESSRSKSSRVNCVSALLLDMMMIVNDDICRNLQPGIGVCPQKKLMTSRSQAGVRNEWKMREHRLLGTDYQMHSVDCRLT